MLTEFVNGGGGVGVGVDNKWIGPIGPIVDGEQSSFYPQSHARRASMYTIMQKKNKRLLAV